MGALSCSCTFPRIDCPSGCAQACDACHVARDAEHRAELAAAQRTIEQLGEDGAAMAEKLDRAVELLTRVPKYVREDRAVTPGSTRLSRLCLSIDAFLAPPPAESTPASPAPPDDIRERLSEALENIERMKERYSEQSRELAEMEQERNDWRQQRVDVGLRYDLFKINHKGQGCGRREGDAALEAKGEPGTHADDICARPKCLSPRHYNIHDPERGGHVFVEPKGAKP